MVGPHPNLAAPSPGWAQRWADVADVADAGFCGATGRPMTTRIGGRLLNKLLIPRLLGQQ